MNKMTNWVSSKGPSNLLMMSNKLMTVRKKKSFEIKNQFNFETILNIFVKIQEILKFVCWSENSVRVSQILRSLNFMKLNITMSSVMYIVLLCCETIFWVGQYFEQVRKIVQDAKIKSEDFSSEQNFEDFNFDAF